MRVSLSTLPAGIVSVVAPPLILPFVTLIGSTVAKGAPVGATALNCPSATFCSETVIGNGATTLSPMNNDVRFGNPENTPSGNSLSWLLNR